MSGVNKAIIVGNVGNDPECRYTPNGNAVANFSIATSESWKDKQGAKQEHTEWHRAVAFNRTAEIIEKYVKKGDKLYIEGKIQTRSYEQDGVKKYTTEIVVRELQMLSPKSPGTSDTRAGTGGDTRQPQSAADLAQQAQDRAMEQNAPQQDNFDDDLDGLPF